MLHAVSHYFPTDSAEAACGRYADVASGTPTCPRCAAIVADEDALDAQIADTPLPLDADEAATELDPVLNAGLPTRSPLAEELWDLARTLNAIALVSALGGGR
jgi:hypothetical protein